MFRSANARRPERPTGANTPTSQRLRTVTGEAGGAAPAGRSAVSGSSSAWERAVYASAVRSASSSSVSRPSAEASRSRRTICSRSASDARFSSSPLIPMESCSCPRRRPQAPRRSLVRLASPPRRAMDRSRRAPARAAGRPPRPRAWRAGGGGGAERVEVRAGRHARLRLQRLGERGGGGLRLVDALGVVRLAQTGEPGAELREMAAARRLLRHLAERRERRRLPYQTTVGQRPRIDV